MDDRQDRPQENYLSGASPLPDIFVDSGQPSYVGSHMGGQFDTQPNGQESHGWNPTNPEQFEFNEHPYFGHHVEEFSLDFGQHTGPVEFADDQGGQQQQDPALRVQASGRTLQQGRDHAVNGQQTRFASTEDASLLALPSDPFAGTSDFALPIRPRPATDGSSFHYDSGTNATGPMGSTPATEWSWSAGNMSQGYFAQGEAQGTAQIHIAQDESYSDQAVGFADVEDRLFDPQLIDMTTMIGISAQPWSFVNPRAPSNGGTGVDVRDGAVPSGFSRSSATNRPENGAFYGVLPAVIVDRPFYEEGTAQGLADFDPPTFPTGHTHQQPDPSGGWQCDHLQSLLHESEGNAMDGALQYENRAQGDGNVHEDLFGADRSATGNTNLDVPLHTGRMSRRSSISSQGTSCEFCNADFSGAHSKGSLARHIRQKHRGQRAQYHCEEPDCERTFCRSDARLNHYRKHHRHRAPGEPIRRDYAANRRSS